MSVANQPIRVLLVDDSLPFRELLGLLLARDERFVVVGEARDGVEGIRLVKEHQPDVVLLDVAMPRMDGLQALPEMKAAAPATKVVMLSSFSATEMDGKASDQGADAYLEKGQPLQEIGATILNVYAG